MEHVNINVDYKVSKSIGFHRDLSWLSFNERVLQEAKDTRNPILERVKFLGIYSKNISEFFHVRMSFHLNLIRINKSTRKKLNYSPKRLIKQIIKIANEQQIEFSRIFNDEILPEMAANDIHFLFLNSINENQRKFIDAYFDNTLKLYVEPVLMRGKCVNPFLKDGSLYLGVELEDKNESISRQEFGLIRIPSDKLPRFIQIPSQEGTHNLMLLDDILRNRMTHLFPGFKISGAYSFKLTRDAELYIDKNISSNLKEAIKKNLNKRQIGTPARFVYDRQMPTPLLRFLIESFDLNKFDRIKEGKYQNLSDLLKLPDLKRPSLKFSNLSAIKYLKIEDAPDVFKVVKHKDHCIFPPYHSFKSVIKFFEQASLDKNVKEIYITQYRIGQESSILNALIVAAKNGIKVTVFVEVQARFDEAVNLKWGERLEQEGVHVIYSMKGIKVHCKIGLIVKAENDIIQNYAILSTGNFHEVNSSIYSDVCLFTHNPEICIEVKSIFNYLIKNGSQMPSFKHLLVGKFNLRTELNTLIDKEISFARLGMKAHIILKVNSLEDPQIIEKLIAASHANVKIELIVRGICCIPPDIIDKNKNMNAISIVDRYLEHSRVYYFYQSGEEKLYLSSADWMTRNLSRRIEAAFPIYSPLVKLDILKMLHLQLNDNVKARMIDKYQTNPYKINDKALVQSQLDFHKYLALKTNRTLYSYRF